MGSAKETKALQLLKQEAVPEDAHQPTSSSPCDRRKNSCLQNASCASGDFTMRNCCVNELSTKDSSQKVTMVDNPNQKEKVPAVDPKSSADLLAATEPPVLKNTSVGGTPSEAKGETAACHDWKQNSKQDVSMKEIPGSSVTVCSHLERKASPVAGEACRHLPTEPCLKGPNKDSSSTPTSLKHVAFLEPIKSKAEEESIQTKTVHSEMTPALPACLQNTSQGQPLASKGDKSHISSDICEAVEFGNEGSKSLFASEAMKQSILELSEAETTSGKLDKPVTTSYQLGHSEETRFPVAEAHPPGDSCKVPDVLVTSISYEVKHQGTSGELESSPSESMEEKTGLREATSSNCKSQDQAHGKKVEMISIATSEDHTTNGEMASVELLAQTCVFEVTPPQHDAGTQVDNRVSLVSVAISPINPPDGSTAFTFHTRGLGTSSLKSPGPEEKPTKRDVEMQVSIPVETRSVATGPMTPVTKSPQSSYPEVHIKGAQEETSEPIREVSWDEKGMTWEVYGASMEVEVLGMAIQKHLEKQIEEHGRQMVMTPQSTRSSSVKAAPRKGEIKRQPSVFRALLQNVRRPRCCSRGGPAVE
ncbi:G protein-regulated inducer of neurite outgrowth 1 [Python bivittatus]|uniref:G protein-regulated inducer of neurite outgrowth 1 n=1 Tax=Python bivittatus TaxID=176946 RepID=A0A9F5J959_PYTBI|nr:G protein-regulated inducer of neurite outgrowth 1 [Python bivittatus]